MVCRRTSTHSASYFVRGNMLDQAGGVNLCLCTSLFLQHAQTHSGVLQTLALRALVTDISVPVKSLHRCNYSRETELLQRQLKTHKNFPVTTCTLSRSASIAETSTTTPAYPYQHYIGPKALLLNPSFLFSFYLPGSQTFTLSYSFLLQP